MKVNKKVIRRISSFAVVIALVMSLSLFSVTAYAETLKDFTVSLDYRLYHPSTGSSYGVALNSVIQNHDRYLISSDIVSGVPMDYAMQVHFKAIVENTDGSLILKEGDKFDFSISGLSLGIGIDDTPYEWTIAPHEMNVGLVHTDGSVTYLYDVDWVYSGGSFTHAIKVSGKAPKDVVEIIFFEQITQYYQTGVHAVRSTCIWMGDTVTPTALEVEIQSKEAGLLEDIGDQIGSAINGTPQQNQQAQDAVGGLNSSTDKLGQLGDQMSSVEKPTIDSNKISAGSLVPSTSLVVLSSPFQALWENKQLLAMLTIVVTLVLVSWVFFGKKG